VKQDSGPPEPTAGKLAVDPNPSPDKEGGFFSSADEKRQGIQNKHELDLHDRKAGWIGKITGSTNSSLNVATAMVAGLTIALFICLGGGIYKGFSEFSPFIEKLIAAILTVGGFIFGVGQGRSDK
jgi:hypothetical protein